MISFRYELEGAGWADAYLSDGGEEVLVPASYLCDALGDLVDAVVSLSSTNSANCTWLEEPGEVRWKFFRESDSLEVVVDLYFEVEERPGSGQWHLVLDKTLFSGKTLFSDFVSQIQQALERTLEKWGEKKYLEEWKYPFPHESYRRLQQAMKHVGDSD